MFGYNITLANLIMIIHERFLHVTLQNTGTKIKIIQLVSDKLVQIKHYKNSSNYIHTSIESN
ncbi:hypothetical protein Glove_606g17 [Diversispora epigaea]|uniref:Uncharacterized protein n=1 Tax=Diversispora epigaea TaxID=1348612 RepID=A0A397G8B7_9GLOM|nr:hypothetical protein Glove_606g17 [Diversispora epigaea]